MFNVTHAGVTAQVESVRTGVVRVRIGTLGYMVGRDGKRWYYSGADARYSTRKGAICGAIENAILRDAAHNEALAENDQRDAEASEASTAAIDDAHAAAIAEDDQRGTAALVAFGARFGEKLTAAITENTECDHASDIWCDNCAAVTERCVACGEPIDYCQGHGEIGDPIGFAIIGAHEGGNHRKCHTTACDAAAAADAELATEAIAQRAERVAAFHAASGRTTRNEMRDAARRAGEAVAHIVANTGAAEFDIEKAAVKAWSDAYPSVYLDTERVCQSRDRVTMRIFATKVFDDYATERANLTREIAEFGGVASPLETIEFAFNSGVAAKPVSNDQLRLIAKLLRDACATTRTETLQAVRRCEYRG